MNPALLLAAFVSLLPFSPQANPYETPQTPRQSFRTAAESTIDAAAAVNYKGTDAEFNPEMQTLKTDNLNLSRMADVDSERAISAAVNDLIFAITACHIVVKGGSPATQCDQQVNDARQHAMDILGAKKINGSWQNTPPA